MLGCSHLFHTFLANVYFYMFCRSSYSCPLGNNKPSLSSSLAPLSCSENIVSASAIDLPAPYIDTILEE